MTNNIKTTYALHKNRLDGPVIFSCKKEDTPDKPAAASMSATVDGQPWAPDTGLAEINEVTFENIPLSGLLPSELIFSATVGAPGIYNPFFPSAYVSTVTGNIEISSAEEDGISGYQS